MIGLIRELLHTELGLLGAVYLAASIVLIGLHHLRKRNRAP